MASLLRSRLPLLLVATAGLAGSTLVTPSEGATPLTDVVSQSAPTTLDVSVRGMDDGIRRLGEFKGNPQAQQAALVMTLLRGVGKPGPDGQLSYKVDITPEGHVVINQLDVSAISEMLRRTPK